MFGIQPWDMEIGGNFKNIAPIISKGNRVLYINRPLDWITYFRNRKDPKTKARLNSIRKKESPFYQINDSLWVLNIRKILYSINFLPKGFVYRYFNKKNSKRIADEIRFAMKELGFRNPILIIDNDFFNGLYLKEYLKPDVFVYYLRDYLRYFDYFKKHGAEAEPAIMRKADFVITDSVHLNNYAQKYNPHCMYISKGTGEEFRRSGYAEPEDMKGIPHPRIGYLGTIISSRLDLKLIENLVKNLPEFHFIFVGPEDEDFKTSELHKQGNVHFLGFKEQVDAPAYMQYFDVCVNIQLLNETTVGNHPRKINEYLSMGKPVVATRTHAMEEYKAVVFLCENEKEYLQAIKEGAEQINDKEMILKRQNFANQFTWEATVENFYKVIRSVYEKKST